MKRILTTAALSLALLVPVAPAAHAKDDDGEVIRTGSCSGTADWKLKERLGWRRRTPQAPKSPRER